MKLKDAALSIEREQPCIEAQVVPLSAEGDALLTRYLTVLMFLTA
jgi:hypothetical protein